MVNNKEDFVEAKLSTKYADFQIRVYPNAVGKETVVLTTQNLDIQQSVLVRVHSECLTGDLLGSLHCDCGQQLAKSLHLISEEGGVLIYLRQEGRGIGLLEKMKAYKLQAQGYDTFEANIMLGHRPDERSYDQVKTILDDLQIKKIKLLTNNPSKVSDIAQLGIEVVDRVPLIIKANSHDKRYLETKQKKFHHFFSNNQNYFYQFHVDVLEQLDPIIEFIKNKNTDPLLKICVGIAADHSTLQDKKEINRIDSILKACQAHPEMTPIIHFSFRNSKDVVSEILEIKKNWPQTSRLQINDLPCLKMEELSKAAEHFSLDIPLSDDNFDIVNNPIFRELVQKNRSLILLDNSKGRGIQESKENLIKKIDLLLSYGLNDIALCGGFGPDHLDLYFELKNFYRINFSIDAETNLKTNGKFCVEKIKNYLLQLIHRDPVGVT